MRAVKRMGRGMVERYGGRPGRELDQPAFTIRASAGGMEPHGFVWEDGMSNAIRITPQEASILQSYPADFVWEVSLPTGRKMPKSKIGLQIGNAVPPLQAEAVLAHLWSPPVA